MGSQPGVSVAVTGPEARLSGLLNAVVVSASNSYTRDGPLGSLVWATRRGRALPAMANSTGFSTRRPPRKKVKVVWAVLLVSLASSTLLA